MALTVPRYARILAQAVRRSSPPATPPITGRAEAIALIVSTIDRKERHARRGRWATGVLSAVALFLAGVGMSHSSQRSERATSPSPPAVVVHMEDHSTDVPSASGATSSGGTPLAAGSHIRTKPEAGALLTLSTGTRIAVAPASEVAVIDDGLAKVFDLRDGSLQADVAKLAPQERFVLRTPDAEVEVRGTSFQVSVVPSDSACGDGSRTRVVVREGVVVVRSSGREDAVRKGERWPAGCPSVPTSVASKKVSLVPPRPLAVTSSGSLAAAPSNLAEQNDRFAEAMLAAQNGETAAALTAFDRFLARYPASPLAENAAAERMKLLASSGGPKAAAAAQQYVAHYPAGFARATAEAILRDAP